MGVFDRRRRNATITTRNTSPGSLAFRVGVMGLALAGQAAFGAPLQEPSFMPAQSETEQQLISAYRQMQRFMVAADTRSLKPLLTDDFTLVHMTGYAQPRDEWLEHIDNGRMRYFSAEEKDVAVLKFAGQRATLRGRNLVKANIWGAQGTWPLQLDIEFALIDGRWLMRHASASTY
jgi:hypothetical protein